jgi:hypothetical protein
MVDALIHATMSIFLAMTFLSQAWSYSTHAPARWDGPNQHGGQDRTRARRIHCSSGNGHIPAILEGQLVRVGPSCSTDRQTAPSPQRSQLQTEALAEVLRQCAPVARRWPWAFPTPAHITGYGQMRSRAAIEREPHDAQGSGGARHRGEPTATTSGSRHGGFRIGCNSFKSSVGGGIGCSPTEISTNDTPAVHDTHTQFG